MTSEANPRYRTLMEALAAAPAERPFITFWIDEDEQETVTFGEFRDRALVQANLLCSHGVHADDRVVIVMPQGIPAMATFAGAMMLGAVPAFLAYPNFKVEPAKYRSGLAGVTSNLKAELIVIDDAFPEDLLEHISVEGAKVIRARVSVPERIEEVIAPLTDPDCLAFIQHSAGTTGLQKGVALTHSAVLTQIEHLCCALQIDESDRIYSWLPLYHDMGLIACFMLPLVCHIPVVMQSPLDWVMHPETMLQVISDHKCTLAWMPNFGFQFVPRRSRRECWAACDVSSLRALINCSEPVRSKSMEEFRTAFASIGLKSNALQSSYAMAENVFAVTQSDIERGPAKVCADGRSFRNEHKIVRPDDQNSGDLSFVSSGRLLPNNELRIVSEDGGELPEGNVGEILIRSDSLFDGYYNRPDLTSETIENGWYRSGDLGFLLDGELYVVGRKKDLLIVGGENIYPQDIEETVSAHPAIHDGRAIAMGIDNPETGTEDIIVVAEVERDELLANSEQIERELRNQIVGALGVSVRAIVLKPPKWIVKSTAGKASRSATREKFLRESPQFIDDQQMEEA